MSGLDFIDFIGYDASYALGTSSAVKYGQPDQPQISSAVDLRKYGIPLTLPIPPRGHH